MMGLIDWTIFFYCSAHLLLNESSALVSLCMAAVSIMYDYEVYATDRCPIVRFVLTFSYKNNENQYLLAGTPY